MAQKINSDSYRAENIEVCDFIDAFSLNFNLGNVIKYIACSGLKHDEDYLTALSKAEWYLHREIKHTMMLELN